MLMSAGLPLPESVFAHGFMLMRGERMSKTRGNILDPDVAAALFGVDGVRYVVLREIPFDRDGDVTAESLVRRYNAELANDLGNLVNRTVSMSARYLDHALPSLAGADAPADAELQRAAASAVRAYHAAMGRHHLDEALGAVMDLTSAANGYAESQAPWARDREGDQARVGAILAAMAETCRILGHLMAPFTPAAAAELQAQLGVPSAYDDRGAGGPGLARLLAWGSGPDGWRTGDAQPLFPRVELPEPEPAPAGDAP
jgi:methionyl-tRNA synthetase